VALTVRDPPEADPVTRSPADGSEAVRARRCEHRRPVREALTRER
jgi:hypothetical protein